MSRNITSGGGPQKSTRPKSLPPPLPKKLSAQQKDKLFNRKSVTNLTPTSKKPSIPSTPTQPKKTSILKRIAKRLTRSSPQKKNSPANLTSTLKHQLSSGKSKHAKFNQTWDKLLKKTGSQEEAAAVLKKEIGNLSNAEITALALTGKLTNRSFDPVAKKTIYSLISTEVSKRGIEDSNITKALGQASSSTSSTITNLNGELTKLGDGAVNVVYSGTFTDESGVTFGGVFKPEPASLSTKTKVMENAFGTAKRAGIPVGDQSFLSERSVATAKVDQLLGLDVSVKTHFAVINGQRGIVMEKAEGHAPKITGTRKEVLKMTNPFAESLFAKGSENLSKTELEIAKAQLGAQDIEFKSDGSIEVTYATFQTLSPTNPTTCQSLIDLQILDVITGQVDRHPQNYFIQEDGTVKAIDNDCAFGTNAMQAGKDVRSQKGIVPNNASLMLRPPPVVTQAQADKIRNIDTAAVSQELSPLLSPDEVTATLDRIQLLKDHVNNEETCTIVSTTDELLLPENRAKMDSNNSYLVREQKTYDQNAGNWNHLRVHRAA